MSLSDPSKMVNQMSQIKVAVVLDDLKVVRKKTSAVQYFTTVNFDKEINQVSNVGNHIKFIW